MMCQGDEKQKRRRGCGLEQRLAPSRNFNDAPALNDRKAPNTSTGSVPKVTAVDKVNKSVYLQQISKIYFIDLYLTRALISAL